jgi:hypothetical protein
MSSFPVSLSKLYIYIYIYTHTKIYKYINIYMYTLSKSLVNWYINDVIYKDCLKAAVIYTFEGNVF